MIKKTVRINDLIKILRFEYIAIEGPTENVLIDNLADLNHVSETTLDWVNSNKSNKQEISEESKANVLLVDNGVHYTIKHKKQGKTLIYVKNPRKAIALVGNAFFVEKYKPEIHQTAIVDAKAQIGTDVYIGAYCIIGKSIIGNNCVLLPHTRVYDNVIIGNNCYIKEGVVIGGDGFGFEHDESGNLFRFPQLGSVVIGNNVEIGSNSCIDRGAFSDTIIGDYTKIDNLCHIAHNNSIGKNCVVTAGTIISGSNTIGDNVWFGPNSSVRDWCKIESNSFIGIGSSVIKRVKEGNKVFGVPAAKIDY